MRASPLILVAALASASLTEAAPRRHPPAESSSAQPPELWQGYRAGMSVAEVRARLPAAVDLGDVAGEQELKATDQQVLGAKTTIIFRFGGSGLDEVDLNLFGQVDDRLLDGLRSKYGAPSECNGANCSWYLPNLHIFGTTATGTIARVQYMAVKNDKL